MSKMTIHLTKSTRIIGGKKFYLDSLFERKSEAQSRAKLVRYHAGVSVRVVKVHNFKEGKNWAVFIKQG
jgi:hypothetical protein